MHSKKQQKQQQTQYKNRQQKTEDKNHEGAQDIRMCERMMHHCWHCKVLFLRIMAAGTKLFLQRFAVGSSEPLNALIKGRCHDFGWVWLTPGTVWGTGLPWPALAHQWTYWNISLSCLTILIFLRTFLFVWCRDILILHPNKRMTIKLDWNEVKQVSWLLEGLTRTRLKVHPITALREKPLLQKSAWRENNRIYQTLIFCCRGRNKSRHTGRRPEPLTAYRLTFYKYNGTRSKLIKCDWIWKGSGDQSQALL